MFPIRFPAVIALLAVLFASSSLAQSNLVLPSTPDDFNKLANPAMPSGACPTCGVVTRIQGTSVEVGKMAPPATPGGAVVHGGPLLGTGTSVQDARNTPMVTSWEITVRYDNGQYTTVRQSEKPAVREGDTVNLAEGRVNPL